MKKILILGLIVLMLGLTACTGEIDRGLKDVQSNLAGGLSRQITVYNLNGEPIKVYKGKIDIDPQTDGGKIKFEVDGKRVIIYNAVTIAEEN